VLLSARRPMWHFVGLWATFVAGFSFMGPGMEMHDGLVRGPGLPRCDSAVRDGDHGRAPVVLPRLLRVYRPTRCPAQRQANWPAIVSLTAASAYGATASAILPAHLGFATPRDWGPIPPESWLLAGFCYVVLAAAAKCRAANMRRVLGFQKRGDAVLSQIRRTGARAVRARHPLEFLGSEC
jgi:hypothetical protein